MSEKTREHGADRQGLALPPLPFMLAVLSVYGLGCLNYLFLLPVFLRQLAYLGVDVSGFPAAVIEAHVFLYRQPVGQALQGLAVLLTIGLYSLCRTEDAKHIYTRLAFLPPVIWMLISILGVACRWLPFFLYFLRTGYYP